MYHPYWWTIFNMTLWLFNGHKDFLWWEMFPLPARFYSLLHARNAPDLFYCNYKQSFIFGSISNKKLWENQVFVFITKTVVQKSIFLNLYSLFVNIPEKNKVKKISSWWWKYLTYEGFKHIAVQCHLLFRHNNKKETNEVSRHHSNTIQYYRYWSL